MRWKSSQGMRPQRAGDGESPVEKQLDKWPIEGEVKEFYSSIRDVRLRYKAEDVLAFFIKSLGRVLDSLRWYRGFIICPYKQL